MKPRLLLGLLVVAAATNASAHRLDEYLQATRVAVTSNRIDLSIRLTPGVAVAGRLLIGIDMDGDGSVSNEELMNYARRVLKDLHLALDEMELSLTLLDASFPSLAEINAGVGVVHLKAAAPIDSLKPGNHTLALKNLHLPDISVYQVNALVPTEGTIRITRQVRDESQTDYRLEFESMTTAR